MTNSVATSRIFLAVAALVIALGTIPFDSRLAAQQSDGLSPQVVAQINALMAEKASRTPAQRKMDSQLVYAAKMARGEQIASNVATLRVNLADVNERGVVLDVRADVSDGLLDQMRALGADVLDVSATYRNVRIRVGLGRIEAIAGLPDIAYVQPAQESVTSGSGTVGRQAMQTVPGSIRGLQIQKRIERPDVVSSVRRGGRGWRTGELGRHHDLGRRRHAPGRPGPRDIRREWGRRENWHHLGRGDEPGSESGIWRPWPGDGVGGAGRQWG